ncbi:MAG: hypothetical protein HGA87_07010 [Desulfobulbaceae bacterium]|nr:hypothetical protein [Desulfobulbaceae bacterium]
MHTLDGRCIVLQDLPAALRQSIKEDAAVRGHVANIVMACREYAWGMEAFLDAVVAQDGGSHPVEMLLEAVQRIRPQPVSRQQVYALRDILLDIDLPDDRELRRLYQECVPPDTASWQELEERGFLYCALDTLAQMAVIADAPHPLIRFGRRLLDFARGATANQLSDWNNDLANALGCPVEAEALVKAEPTEQQPLYLLVELMPQIGAATYKLQAWVWSEQRKEPVYTEEVTYALDKIPAMIEHFINNLILDDRIRAQVEPIIELFLPITLLNYDFKAWKSEDGLLSLHAVYCLTLRSQERANQRQYWPKWFGIWQHLGDLKCPANQVPVVNIVNYDHEEIEKMYIIIDQSVFVSILCSLPEKDEIRKKFFSLIFRAGIPIALWYRTLMCDYTQVQRVYDTLRQGILHQLPYNTWERQRQALVSPESAEDQHLVLLWDDPQRLPHYQHYLSAPQQEQAP